MKLSDILIVSDFDFTLTGEGHRVPEKNKDAIRAFIEKGGHFCIGSGRNKNQLKGTNDPVPVNAPCLVSNGSVLYDFEKEEPVFMAEFSDEEAEAIVQITDLMPEKVMMFLENGFETYIPKEVIDRTGETKWAPKGGGKGRSGKETQAEPPKILPVREIPRPWTKITYAGDVEDIEILKKLCEERKIFGYGSMPQLHEVQPFGINKGTSARKLCDMLGLSTLVCVGDAMNDLPMLQAADYAFIPENAAEELHMMGFRECCHCEEGAIADVIRILTEICKKQ